MGHEHVFVMRSKTILDEHTHDPFERRVALVWQLKHVLGTALVILLRTIRIAEAAHESQPVVLQVQPVGQA